MSKEELVKRINDYLYTGGLFNPELADHDKVRMLLIDIRDYMADSEEVAVATKVVFVSAENDGRSVRMGRKG